DDLAPDQPAELAYDLPSRSRGELLGGARDLRRRPPCDNLALPRRGDGDGRVAPARPAATTCPARAGGALRLAPARGKRDRGKRARRRAPRARGRRAARSLAGPPFLPRRPRRRARSAGQVLTSGPACGAGTERPPALP